MGQSPFSFIILRCATGVAEPGQILRLPRDGATMGLRFIR